LAVLLAIQDALPDGGELLLEYRGGLLVLVPDIAAWEDWTLHLVLRHYELVAEHVGEDASLRSRLESYFLVEQCPVEVLRGELADVPWAVAA
jgi:hypothetical protein